MSARPLVDIPASGASTVASAFKLGVRSSLRHPWLAAGFLTATVTQGLMQGLLVWALREVLLRLSATTDSTAQSLTIAALVIFGLWGLRAGSAFVGEVLSVRLSHKVEMDSIQGLLAKLLSLPVRFFDKSSQGDLVIASYQDMRGIRTVTLHVASIVSALARLAGLGVVVFVMSPKLAAIGIAAALIGILPAHWLGRRITRAAQSERETVMAFYDSFMQVITGIRVIKVNRGEERILGRAREIAHTLYRHLVGQSQAKGLAHFMMETVSGLGLIVVLVVGGRDVAAGALEWQSLMSLLVAIMAVHGPITSLLQVYNSVRTVMPNLDRVQLIMETPSEVADAPNARPLREAPHTVQLDDVSFGYGDAPVLRSVSATFYRGETVGIVGPSGTGKSTLLSLLLRLYDPTGGRVLYDGVDARELRHADLMAQCAIVLQEPFLFLDTIANNIRATRPDASIEEVIEAAKAANIHDEIMLMERGYDTIVGRSRDARGVSVGQKQRICIAAALLKNAPILFLDEATSNLDSVSERAVQAAIERLMAGRTTFMIAHRLSTLRTVDRILVLDQGRLVGLGPHEELLQSCPTYRTLWRSQSIEKLADDAAAFHHVPDGAAVTNGIYTRG